MEQRNKTMVEEFILLAFVDLHHIQNFIFLFFMLTYITCVIENIAIITIVRIAQSLHKPMYFFISVFSTLEILFVSVTVPKLLAILIADSKTISFNGCIVQMYFLNSLGVTECYLLVVMVFDRYLAINKPLHYPTIMTHSVCIALAIFPWIFGFSICLILAIITTQLEFCGPNIIDHFFCDLAPLQTLACSDTSISSFSTSIATVINVVLPFLIIIGFYIRILNTVTKIRSKDGKQKAFSTCTSHLIVAGLFYGAAIIVYIKPKGSHYDKYLTFMYTAFTPTINPFIYTFRNRDVKKAFIKSERIRLCRKSQKWALFFCDLPIFLSGATTSQTTCRTLNPGRRLVYPYAEPTQMVGCCHHPAGCVFLGTLFMIKRFF
ncbi:olfactory receptor 6N1-like [Dendropsophus ebraccatus]|uniref:olfactory receptor 6N1-like n=1 Tax=Dendropsophus ebraccatus TaxID=150705 RepID=UPI0038320DA7